MSQAMQSTELAYHYPLLIKQLLFAPVVDQPDQEIVYRGSCRFSYRQFRERVRRLAAGLVSVGIKSGQTVAIMDWDSHRYLECYYAVPMIGAVLHTINVRLSLEQLIYTIDHAEDDLILVNTEFLPILEQIKGRIDNVKKFILINDTDAEPTGSIPFAVEYEKLLTSVEPLSEFPDFDENTRATTFYTTGTTGLPKGVYFSHRQLVLHTLATCATLSSAAVNSRFHREDVYMPLTPMFHVHAWGMPYVATMLGVKQVYPGRYAPDILLKLIAEEKVTFSHCVPTILNMLLKDPRSAQVDFTKWKVIIGGAALPRALTLAALKRGIDIFAGYGLSETCPVLTLTQLTSEQAQLDLEVQADLRRRTGVPFTMVVLDVINEQGQSVAKDDKTSGEIIVRSPWLTQGYLKDGRNSEKLWADGWLHTQDVACWNKVGAIRITDRTKDVIKIGGEWVSSLELEDIISAHPAVAEVAIIGLPDATWSEVPLALVVLKPDHQATDRELALHVKKYVDQGVLTREALLIKSKFVESIDKTSIGKINKVALRLKYLE
jgi:fatty-acyl-CoA synthase